MYHKDTSKMVRRCALWQHTGNTRPQRKAFECNGEGQLEVNFKNIVFMCGDLYTFVQGPKRVSDTW